MFLRHRTAAALESARAGKEIAAAIKVQRLGRGVLARKGSLPSAHRAADAFERAKAGESNRFHDSDSEDDAMTRASAVAAAPLDALGRAKRRMTAAHVSLGSTFGGTSLKAARRLKAELQRAAAEATTVLAYAGPTGSDGSNAGAAAHAEAAHEAAAGAGAEALRVAQGG